MCKMLRIILLPLLLFTLSMACTAQTFQYSRGWTNGKRTIGVPTHYHRTDDDSVQDLYEMQDGERKLEKCLVQLQRVLRNQMFMPHQMSPPVDLRATLESPNSGRVVGLLARNPNNNNDNINNSNNNNNNNPYSNHRHQSNELFEELSGLEGNDYGKH